MVNLFPQKIPIHWREGVPFYVYCLSFSLVVFLSIHAIHNWPSLWARIFISVTCIAPFLFVLLNQVPIWIQGKALPREFTLFIALILLGIINILVSEDRWASFKGMTLFLMSGAMVFVVTSHLINSKAKQTGFFLLCTFCLFINCFYGILEFVFAKTEHVNIFSSNPIPAACILILLSIGPLMLLPGTTNNWRRWVLVLCLVLSALTIILIGKRGPFLSLLAMVLFFGFLHIKRFWIYFLLFFLLCGVGVHLKSETIFSDKSKLMEPRTILMRLDYYFLGLKILEEKPMLGIGYNAPLLEHYRNHAKESLKAKFTTNFLLRTSLLKNTLDNMAVTLLSETGIIFFSIYSMFIIYPLAQLIPAIRNRPASRVHAILLLTVIVGFFVHSMTFDSLKYPHLNWTFHSILGIIASFSKVYSGAPPDSGIASRKHRV